jgi:hypothetical protein
MSTKKYKARFRIRYDNYNKMWILEDKQGKELWSKYKQICINESLKRYNKDTQLQLKI